MQPTLPLSAQLAVGELNVDTEHALLNTMQLVQLAKSIQRNGIRLPATIKLCNPLTEAPFHLEAQALWLSKPSELVRSQGGSLGAQRFDVWQRLITGEFFY